MKLTLNRVFFLLFVLVWLGASVASILGPRQRFSQEENRYLATFPSFSAGALLGGRYMGGVEDYVNDHFVGRDRWIAAQSMLEFIQGKREVNSVWIGKGALFGRIEGPAAQDKQKNIAGIQAFMKMTGLATEVMIVPSASDIQKDKLPAFAQPWSQQETIAEIYSALGAARCIPVAQTLSDHRDEYIYYRTDHHWTTYGAYLAYRAYCVALGLPPEDYKAKTVSGQFTGTLYSKSGVRWIQSDVIEAFDAAGDAVCEIFDGKSIKQHEGLYFPEYLSEKDKYAYFLGANQPIIRLRRAGDGPKLIVFKDSYSHCLAPMLLFHFAEVTLVDLRYINQPLTEYLDLAQYDRALFLCSIDTFVNQNHLYKLASLTGESKLP